MGLCVLGFGTAFYGTAAIVFGFDDRFGPDKNLKAIGMGLICGLAGGFWFAVAHMVKRKNEET